jgi:hypothetical protein
MPALLLAQRSMKSDFDSDPDFDIQTSKHRDQNRIFIQIRTKSSSIKIMDVADATAQSDPLC